MGLLYLQNDVFSEREHVHVHVRYMLSPVRLSVVCLSVTLVPWLSLLTCTKNFTEIVPGEPLRRGS